MEASQGAFDSIPEVGDGARSFGAQERLELGEGLLDAIEVGAVEQPGSGCLDALADAADLVGGQVVEHDRVAGPEIGHEHSRDVGAEGLPVHCPIEQPGRGDAAGAQARRHGGGLPVALGQRSPRGARP